ncbi:mRNA degradation pet127, mitochondrial [Lecanosticta acicola]|uniref:mRNA degradation pet127, mitochondrial n=1 Tax=Lecanosticta acicola TaxID=111012 RepID=A0AAI8YSV3_9PEZI|nr:mRNA degradation pet127, mitochondrial [Lecanosticta acicola]
MLANLAHTPAWRKQGHICLACRHQRRLLQHQQRRWNQSTSDGPEHIPPGENFFDSFNDISETYGEGRKARPPAERGFPTSRPPAKRGFPTSIPPPLRREGYRLERLINHQHDAVRPTGVFRATGNKHVEDAQHTGLRKEGSSEEKTAFRRARTIPPKTLAMQDRPGDLILAEMQQSADARKSGTGEEKEKTMEDSQAEAAVRSAAVDNKVRVVRPHFVGEVFRKYDSNLPRVDSPPNPAFVPQTRRRWSMSSRVETIRDATSWPVVKDAVDLDLKSSLGGYSRMARLSKQKETHGLPFGGISVAPFPGNSKSVSFDSLRSADKISPEPPRNPAAINSRPYGIALKQDEARLVDGESDGSKDASSDTTEHVQDNTGIDQIDTLRAELTGRYNKAPEMEQASEATRHRLANLRGLREAGSASTRSSKGAGTNGTNATGGSSQGNSGDDSEGNASNKLGGVPIGSAMKAPRRKRAVRRQGSKETKPPKPSATNEQTLDTTGQKDAQRSVSDVAPDDEGPAPEILHVEPSAIHIEPVDIPQPPVPYLQYGLDRVLFNPGVYQLQDPTSRVYNFDPYLQHIMPVVEFDFDSLKQYKTSSQDQALSALAQAHGKKYIGSTSSMTSSLAHFHYLLSNWRPLGLTMISRGFSLRSGTFTQINRAPASIFLRWKDGTYAIDADKEYDSANVLMLLGKSMELLLTLPNSEYERYRKSDPRQVTEEQKTAPESYQYTTMRDFLMRSQLDAYDPRLPGNGTFDLKTRAVVSVRMESKDFEPMTGYEIQSLQGTWGSYEREYYDMIRSTMLKYSLQARMGRMNGIFVAYHNVKRIFGFQYLPLHDMDRALHGQADTCLGDQEFKVSLELMNEVLNKATAKFPEKSLRIHFETQEKTDSADDPTTMQIFAEPMEEEEIDQIQNSQKAKIAAFERDIMGKNEDSPIVQGDSEESSNSDSENVREANEKAERASSDSNADEAFLESMEQRAKEELKPLFYATLIVQSKVNGEIPEEDRPKNLKQTDKWEVGSLLKEYENTRGIWAKYEDMKARRRHALADEAEDADSADPESEGAVKEDSSYIQLLKSMSEQGRQLRRQIDEFDNGREVVKVDDPLPEHRERIEGLEDYLGWLYKEKEGEENQFG